MAIARNRTVCIRKSVGVAPDYSTFCGLLEEDLFCNSKLVRQVSKVGDEYHVSFDDPETVEAVSRHISVDTSLGRFFIDAVEKRRSLVKVYGLPFEVDEGVVGDMFLQLGIVCKVTRDSFPGRTYYNGVRMVLIYLSGERELPPTMVIGGHEAKVLNTSVPHCHLCKKTGYIRRNCPEFKCNTCQEIGHFSNSCPWSFCTLCKMSGHWTRQCRAGTKEKEEKERKEKEKREEERKRKGPRTIQLGNKRLYSNVLQTTVVASGICGGVAGGGRSTKAVAMDAGTSRKWGDVMEEEDGSNSLGCSGVDADALVDSVDLMQTDDGQSSDDGAATHPT